MACPAWGWFVAVMLSRYVSAGRFLSERGVVRVSCARGTSVVPSEKSVSEKKLSREITRRSREMA
jgi:hypothetical protein